MQRIVWINKGNWLNPGAIVYMGLLNARAFAENGCMTDFFVRAGDSSDTEMDLSQFYGLPPHPQLHIHRIPDARGKRSVYLAAHEKIQSYLANGDEVLALTRDLGALAVLLRLKKHHPQLQVLHEAHDYYLTTRHTGHKRFSISTLRRQWAERTLIPKTDGLICLTEHQRALYQQGLPHLPAIALPLGCLDFKQTPGLMAQRRLKRSIAYIGNLDSYKGIGLIFELAGHLKSAGIKLYTYGGGADHVSSLQNKADQQGLKDVLHLHPFINPKGLHDILDSEISLGLVPLQDTFYNRYLTCPVKALDFTAHGLPIIASELPSVRDVLRETGFYCDSQDVPAFARQAIQLLDNQDSYLAASQASYARSQQLQWRSRAQQLLTFVSAAKKGRFGTNPPI